MRKHIVRNLLSNKLSLFLIVFTITGCRKDTPILDVPIDQDSCFCNLPCENFPPPGEVGNTVERTGDQYLHPQFNPNNSNEFIYIRANEDLGMTELVRYDILNQTEIILENSQFIITPPQWGENGWVVFSTIDWKVWKIRDDGSELTQLTFGVNDLDPQFTFSGEEICYRRGIWYSNAELDDNPDLRKEKKMMFIDMNGNAIDSITSEHVNSEFSNIFSYQSWGGVSYHGSDFIYFWGGAESTNGIYKINKITQDLTPLTLWHLPSDEGIPLDMEFTNGTIIYSRFRNTVKTYNIYTGIETDFKCGCPTNYYNVLSLSPDGQKLLVERVLSTVDGSTIDEQHEIWMMDIDGCNEVKILGDP